MDCGGHHGTRLRWDGRVEPVGGVGDETRTRDILLGRPVLIFELRWNQRRRRFNCGAPSLSWKRSRTLMRHTFCPERPDDGAMGRDRCSRCHTSDSAWVEWAWAAWVGWMLAPKRSSLTACPWARWRCVVATTSRHGWGY